MTDETTPAVAPDSQDAAADGAGEAPAIAADTGNETVAADDAATEAVAASPEAAPTVPAEAAPVPEPFVAVIVTLYDVPFVSPLMTQVVPVPSVVHVSPVLAVARYDTMSAPPSSVGGCHETTSSPSPGAVDTLTGTPGTVDGVAVTAEDSSLVLCAFDAVTVIAYSVPFARPAITHEVEGAVAVQVAPPGVAVAVYDVRAGSPTSTGTSHDTDT